MMFPLPRDIKREPEIVHIYPGGRECCNLLTAAGKAEYKHRTMLMLDRQNGLCCICHLPLMPSAATFDHERCRGLGGGFRDDRISLPDGKWLNGAMCWICNSIKGSSLGHYNDEHNEKITCNNRLI